MSLWSERDLPVLNWLAETPRPSDILSTYRHDRPHDGVPALTHAQVSRAVETLHDAGYVSSDPPVYEGGGGVHWTRFQVTGAGKQALGLWPAFDALGEPSELAAILEALADNAPTEEQASYLRRAAAAVRRVGPSVVRGLVVAGLSAAARRYLFGG